MAGVDNRLVITGTVVRQPEKRTSPAGIPITRFTLQHRSERPEAGLMRRVELNLQVIAAGVQLATEVMSLQEGAVVRVSGFLSRPGYRSEESRLVLHAEQLERVQTAGL